MNDAVRISHNFREKYFSETYTEKTPMCSTQSAEKRLKLEAWLEKKKERESSLHRSQQQPVSEPTGTNNDELSGNGTEFRINKRKSLAESIEIASPGTEALLLAGTVCSRDLETGAKNLSRQFNAAADMEPSVCSEALSKNDSSVVVGENLMLWTPLQNPPRNSLQQLALNFL